MTSQQIKTAGTGPHRAGHGPGVRVMKRAWQRRLAHLNVCNRRARRNAARVLAWIEAHQWIAQAKRDLGIERG